MLLTSIQETETRIKGEDEDSGFLVKRHNPSSLTNYVFISFLLVHLKWKSGLPCWLSGKESAGQCRRRGLTPELGRSPGEGNGNPLQYSYLGNPMDRGAWKATAHEVTKESDMTQ